jgi:hypothetical protein
MQMLNNVKLVDYPLHNVIFVLTSEIEYEMSRIIFIENGNQWTILTGYHCSCYDFDETTWDGMTLESETELKKLVAVWLLGDDLEEQMALLIVNYFEWKEPSNVKEQ